MLATTPAGLAAISQTSPQWRYARHLHVLNLALLRVASGETKRLMVFMPPRHGKSNLVSEVFPAWYLGTHPNDSIILASYEADFAAEFGRKCRDLLSAWGPALYGTYVREDSKAANRWQIAGHRGGMRTAGAGGPITGKGAKIFIIDDPVKNREEADSDTFRERLYSWYRSVAYTRLTPDGRMVLLMTRWHSDDLAGRLLADAAAGGDQWEVISLPAIADNDSLDALGRPEGEALWPEEWPASRLAETKRVVGERDWLALYQQRPQAARGKVFRLEWMDNRYRLAPRMRQTFLSLDSAFKAGVGNDYSAFALWGIGVDGGLYLLWAYKARLEYPELKRAMLDAYQRFKPSGFLVEDKASGQSAIQELRRGIPLDPTKPDGPRATMPIIAIMPRGSKEARADAISPQFEARNVYLPDPVYLPDTAEWLAEWIAEHTGFPRAAHDDYVDTSIMAIERLANFQAESMASILDDAPPTNDRLGWHDAAWQWTT